MYQLGFTFYPIWNANVSDHQSFWDRDYKAITSIEDFYGDFNSYFHTVYDRFDKFNIPYFYKFVKCDIAVFLTWALDYRVSMNHIPLTSSSDTSARIAKVYIKSPFRIGTGVNAPRLYYKTGNGPFSYVNTFTVIQDTFKFMIPGKPGGTQISYYIALQDSAGSVTVTLPSGGSGINPPGTTPPPQLHNYSIFESFIFFSNTVPKPIPGLFTIDTIHVQQTGTVVDVNVTLDINHTNDGDLFIRLAKISNISNLSQFNGAGGQNFTNTIFDDSASISITQGTPPYTGRFKPQTPLSVFNSKELSGDWILRIFDKGTGNTGTLLNWSLEIISAPSVEVNGISSIIPEKYILHQNFPNPFNPSTKIRFELPKSSYVKLLIYDILGCEITKLVNEKLVAGCYETEWDGNRFASGVYFYKLVTKEFSETKRMILLK